MVTGPPYPIHHGLDVSIQRDTSNLMYVSSGLWARTESDGDGETDRAPERDRGTECRLGEVPLDLL